MLSQNALVIQQPVEAAGQLILLFHGVGSAPESMAWLGGRLATEFPKALVVSVAAPTRSDIALGYQWFSVVAVTEDNRPARIAEAMPSFVACVADWQARANVTAAATALVGFSQGAVMALESTKLATPLASRVVAISGRFATLPDAAPADVAVHMLHGKADAVIPYSHTVNAAHRLRDLGCDVTADVLPFIGHEIHPELAEQVVIKLTTHIPQRIWASAMEASPTPQTG
jgi:phospholipase/carboxylesterase